MRYMILVAGNERAALAMSPEQGEQTVAAYQKYVEDLKRAGVLLAGEALHGSGHGGARVTVVGGKRKSTDGPFSESKEVVGGYFLIDVKSREEALEWAARCPAAHGAASYAEVRETIAEYSQ
jgi:hypothetical protein